MVADTTTAEGGIDDGGHEIIRMITLLITVNRRRCF